jgi:16S rRNA processing protein RimM
MAARPGSGSGDRASGARVCLGQLGAAHGVRGEVRLHSFTSDPSAIAKYGPLEAEDGRLFEITSLRPAKDHFVATLAGIGDRDAAERLANIKLYVPRERLPEPEQADEFYHADLIGLAVVDRAGEKFGTVIAIHNFGAGDLIEVRPEAGGKTELVQFDETNVPAVDLAAGRIVVDPPEGTFTPSPLAGEGGEGKPSRVRGKTENNPLTRTAAGSRRQRSTLSRKGRG